MSNETQDVQVFHQAQGGAIALIGFSAGLGCAALGSLLSDGGKFFWLMIGTLCAAALIVSLAGMSSSLTLAGPVMTIAYYGRSKVIRADQVEEMYVEQRLVRGVRMQYVHLQLHDGKDVLLNNYREGFAPLQGAVQTWLGKHT